MAETDNNVITDPVTAEQVEGTETTQEGMETKNAEEAVADVAGGNNEEAAPPAEAAAVETAEEEDEQQQGYDPSMPMGDDPEPMAYDPSMSGGYDPSMPMGDDDVAGGGYDPSMPAGEDVPAAATHEKPPQDAEVSREATDEQPAQADDDNNTPAAAAPIAQHSDESTPAREVNGRVVSQQGDYHEQAAVAGPSYTTPFYDVDAAPKVGLPDGLADDSPSVVGNRELVRLYRQQPSDASTALAIFNWSVQKTEINDARAWYEVIAVDNPTASQPMLSLINLELALSNFNRVEELFARALQSSSTLMAAADVNIWKAYLHYIRRQNPSDSSDGDAARATVMQAYEYALRECGIDRESGEIWGEYIQYLAEIKSKNPWETQQHADNLRKVYHRAVAIPLNNVEALWKAYDAFESAQNKQAAKKFLADRSPAYMTARTALREMRSLTDIIPFPPIPPMPDFSEDDRRVSNAWRAYIKWEEGNPLASDDPNLVVTRVSYALKQCMAQTRHFPELWHYSASYHLGGGRTDEGAAFLKAGVTACPKSFLLTFALAELEEDRKNFADCHSIYTALIDAVNNETEELESQVASEVETARGPEIPVQADNEFNGEESDYARLVREREDRGKLVQERRSNDIQKNKTAAGIVWVYYMRFARRAEGLKAARLVFGKARKSANVTWHIFEASALMEYHSNKDSAVAIRIFELGLKLFAEDVDFVTSYLQFLLSINDDSNARALFERSAIKIPADQARPLWETWARFEYIYGDLTAVHKLEARFAEAFPKDSVLKRFASRYTYHGVDEIALRDLGFGRGRTAPRQVHAAAGAASAGPSSMPPFPPNAPRTHSPVRGSPLKRDRSPPRSPVRGDAKRARPASPRRFERDLPAHQNQSRFGQPAAGRGDRSPIPPPRIVPPRVVAPPAAPSPPPPAHQVYHRSGVPEPLTWFIGTLPKANTFDGPIFRPDDIMGLFSNINANGVGLPPGGRGPMRPMPPASGSFRGGNIGGRRY